MRADRLALALLTHLRDTGPVSRAELADRFDVPRQRMPVELQALARSELIRESGLATSRGGRRSTLIELSPDLRFAAVALGASSIDVEIVNGYLEPVAAYSEPADIRSGPKAILATVNDILGKFRTEGHFDRLRALGIGVPGPVSFRDGVLVSPPIMPGWDRYPLRDVLSGEYGCPVVVDNDVNIMAVGERHAGVAHAVDNLLFVKIGTGIGCGIFLDGQIYRGPNGCAGDIGHIQVDEDGPLCSCGNSGCLEAYFGGAALSRDAAAAARSGASPMLADMVGTGLVVETTDVVAAAAAGEAATIQLICDGARRVGTVLAGLVSFVNPSMIVIGGGLADLGHVLLGEIRSVVYRRSLSLATRNLPVVMSELGRRAGVAGSALLASNAAFGSQDV